jgi:ferredoxin-NADP reductase
MNPPSELIKVFVSRKWFEAKRVVGIQLRTLDNSMLPQFTPGSHIDVYLPNGIIRQYSLCNDPLARDFYELGIGLSSESRGGSNYIHDRLVEGMVLNISGPRNNFPLIAGAKSFLFIAGGIGITPILPMLREAQRIGTSWTLLFAVKSFEDLPYRQKLAEFGESVQIHFDVENSSRVDLSSYLAAQNSTAHLYACGPSSMLQTISRLTTHFSPSHLHFESFSAGPKNATDLPRDFRIRLCNLRKELIVPAHKSILEVLEEDGISHSFSCREGLCRSCEVRLISGIPDHRDMVLSESERNAGASIIICVSRAKSELLELDI